METKEKNSYLKIAVILLVIIAIVLTILLIVKSKELSETTKKYNDIKTELAQMKDGLISMTNNSDDNKQAEYDSFDGRADYDPETDELSQEYWLETYEYLLGKFFATYGLTDDGLSLVFSTKEEIIPISLELYKSEDEKNSKYKASNETTSINGHEYKLYKTQINFEDYKKALMEIMSEEVFEDYFTEYAKEIDGELYIVGESTDESNETFVINSVELVKDNTYKVSFTHTNGSDKEEKEVNVQFALNDDGMVIVDKIDL